MKKDVILFCKDQTGTTIMEYALISFMIFLAAIGAVMALSMKFLSMLSA